MKMKQTWTWVERKSGIARQWQLEDSLNGNVLFDFGPFLGTPPPLAIQIRMNSIRTRPFHFRKATQFTPRGTQISSSSTTTLGTTINCWGKGSHLILSEGIR